MKKLLLLAALALGLASNTMQAANLCPKGTQVTNATIGSSFSDGTVIALQCLDQNGGAYYYFKGAATKSTTFSAENLFKLVSYNGNYVLQSVLDKTYVGTAGATAQTNITSVTDIASAMQIKTIAIATVGSWADNEKDPDVVNGTNTIRFTTVNNMFLNTNDKLSYPKWHNGTGGYSVWYVYTFTPAEVAEIAGVEISYEFTDPTGETFTKKVMAYDGDSANDHIPAVSDFFTVTGLESNNVVISKENAHFKVNGTWNLPNFNKVYRAKLRQTTNLGTNNDDKNANRYWVYTDNQGLCRNGSTTEDGVFSPERLWYLNVESIDGDGVKVTVHNVLAGADKGLTLTTANSNSNNNTNLGSFTSTPTVFVMEANNKTSDSGCTFGSFVLRHKDSGATASYLNDVNGHIAIWQNGTTAKNDGGSTISLYMIDEEDDFESDTWNYRGQAITLNAAAKEKASKSLSPEDVTAMFVTSARDYAADLYNTLTGDMAISLGNISRPGYVSATTVSGLYDVLAAKNSTIDEYVNQVIATGNVSSVEYAFTEGQPYVIKSTDLDSRGALCVSAAGEFNTTLKAKEAIDATNPRFMFSFVTVNDKVYMYYGDESAFNAGKFTLNAFGPLTGNSGYNGDGALSWRIFEVPSAVELVPFAGTTTHAVSIKFDRSMLGNEALGGMALIGANWADYCVAAYMGHSNRSDGTGLFFEPVAIPENYPSVEDVRTKIEEALASAESTFADFYYEAPAEGEESEYGYAVNDIINRHKAIISNTAYNHDYRHHIFLNHERNGINTDHAYQLLNAEGKYWYVNAGTPSQESADKEGFEMAKTYWKIEAVEATNSESGIEGQALDDTAYKFTHVITEENKAPQTITLTLNGETAHTLGDDTIGKVKIGDDYYTMVAADSAEKATTTSIYEVLFENAANGAIYDLQGRRLAAPVKGINIINGRKTLVK